MICQTQSVSALLASLALLAMLVPAPLALPAAKLPKPNRGPLPGGRNAHHEDPEVHDVGGGLPNL